MKLIRRMTFICCTALLFYTVERFCHRQTEGFQIVKVHSHLPVNPQWETSVLSEEAEAELRAILSQPFRYLDSGGQCYAFASQDDKVVLKLFKMHHLRQYPWLHRIALPGVLDRCRVCFLSYQKERLERIFSSSKIAFDTLKEETGLLHVQLNCQADENALCVTVIDKLGIAHKLSLNNTPFVLQAKASNAFKMLRKCLAKQDVEGAKQIVDQIIAFLRARMHKGITDLDPALRRNIGLLEGRAIAIDIGSFVRWEKSLTANEELDQLISDTQRMRRWLHKRSPELTAHFDALLQESNQL